jgi:hypothetical protein
MLEHFTPEDKEEEDNDYHKIARSRAWEPVDTTDDKFSLLRKPDA